MHASHLGQPKLRDCRALSEDSGRELINQDGATLAGSNAGMDASEGVGTPQGSEANETRAGSHKLTLCIVPNIQPAGSTAVRADPSKNVHMRISCGDGTWLACRAIPSRCMWGSRWSGGVPRAEGILQATSAFLSVFAMLSAIKHVSA